MVLAKRPAPHRTRRLSVAGVVLVIVVASCTGGDDHAPSEGPAQPRGGVLRVGVLSNEMDNWDPQSAPASRGAWALARCCLFRTLLSYRAGTTEAGGTDLRPDLASALPDVSADGLTWTFHMQEGLHYAPPLQDVEITAPDIVRGLERLLDPTMVGYGWPYWPGLLTPAIEGAQAYVDGKASSISGLEVPDAHTLTVRLTQPNGDLGYLMATWMTAPVPPNPFDPSARFGAAEGHQGDYSAFFVSSGPYMLQGSEAVDLAKPPAEQVPASGIDGDTVTLVRNPSWDPASDPLRPASVDEIRLVQMPFPANPNENAEQIATHRALRAVEAGSVDVLFDVDLPTTQFDRYRNDPVLRSRLYSAQRGGLRYIGINVAEPPFDDVHVRRALNLVVDRSALVAANADQGIPLAPQRHIGLDSQEANLLANYDPYPTPNDIGDLAAAREEMARSRYDRNHDGRCDAAVCDDVTSVGQPAFTGYGSVERSLSEIGIHTRITADDSFFSTYGDPGAHVALRVLDGWVKDYPSAATLFPQFFGSGFIGAGCCNEGLVGATSEQLKKYGYTPTSLQSVDVRIAQCQNLLFQAEVRCWADLDQTLSDQVVPWVPIWVDVAGRSVSERVQSMAIDQSVPYPTPALDTVVLTPEAIAETNTASASPSPASPAVDASSALDGVYRLDVSAAAAQAAGLHKCDQEQGIGTYILAIGGGRWQMTQSITVPESVWAQYPSDCPQPYPNLYRTEWAGSVSVEGRTASFQIDDQPLRASPGWTMTWTDAGGGLDLNVKDGPAQWWPGAFPYRPGRFPWSAGTWRPAE